MSLNPSHDFPPVSAASRRQFLRTCAIAGGGLMLAIALGRSGRAAHAAAAGAAKGTLNAYVTIHPDGTVTLIMPKVEMGQGTFTALPMLVAEELELPLDRISLEPAPPDPKVYGVDGDQSTGGSTSVRDCWMPLRKAGAAARIMLIEAAAHTWGVPASECHAESGAVVHARTGRHLGYGTLAARAAAAPVPSDPPLKPAKDFRLIGRTVPRRDASDKCLGRVVYGIDVAPAGLSTALIAQSPVNGGRVAALDEQAALAVPGVTQIVNDGDLIAVVARSTWPAMKGMKALNVQWSGGPHASVEQAQIIAALEAAAQRPGAIAVSNGNVTHALAHAASRVEATYHQPFLAHATMEPMNCTVHWQNGLCEFWVGTQAIDRAVAKLAALGLKPEEIRIHNQLIGGGFGRRLEVDGIVLSARVARHVEGPVKVLWTREEDIQHDFYRPYYVDRLSAGLDATGRPLAWKHTIAGSSATARWNGTPLKNGVDDDAVESAANPAYVIENFEVRYVQEEPPGVNTSWWRGVGPTRSVFVVESFIDELASATGSDPVKYRRALIKQPRLRAVLDLAAEKAGWSRPLARPRGRGVSLQSAFGSFLALVVEVTVDGEEVRVDRVVCAFDCGQKINPDGVRAQLEGGTIFGLAAALTGEITFANGRVEQGNFNDYTTLRMSQAPKVEVYLLDSSENPGGVGETGTACVMAGLCNAIFAATGKRLRTLPVRRSLAAA